MSGHRTGSPHHGAVLCPSGRTRLGFARRSALALLAVAGLLVTAACTSSNAAPAPARPAPGTPASGSGQDATSSPAGRPGIVAATTSGALVVLNPSTGAVARTLVPSGVADTTGYFFGEDEIAVSPDGRMIYFTGRGHCGDNIESVPASGGTPAVITAGRLPAISPSGSDLAFTRQDEGDCQPDGLARNYSVVIRHLGTGNQVVYPMAPDDTSTLADPIAHLSWAPGGGKLAVSITALQDNEGYNVVILAPATAQFYSTGPGTTSVPVIGSPAASRSYYNEAVYLPDGNLFVNRDCCRGWDPQNPPPGGTNLIQEISSSGSLVRNVAVGIQKDDHGSLAVDPAGNWLLYIAGTPGYSNASGTVTATGTLYVSQDGARPTQIATGILAAAWL